MLVAHRTDFENAAFAVFIVLLTRAMLVLDFDFYVPISKLDEDMERAHRRGAVRNEKFFFRGRAMSVDEIINGTTEARRHLSTGRRWRAASGSWFDGNTDEFPGLVPLVRMYLQTIELSDENAATLEEYLDFISKRASGELMTTAEWVRAFVTTHPTYAGDSIVNERIAADLVAASVELAEGRREAPELLGVRTVPQPDMTSSAEWRAAVERLRADERAAIDARERRLDEAEAAMTKRERAARGDDVAK